MKFFSWVQNKLSGNQSISKPHVHPFYKNQTIKSGDQKEEFSDWPNGFLSIGTLFNKALKDDTKEHNDDKENSFESPQTHEQDFTSEEFKQLQKELGALISSTDLDCLSSFEAENNNGISSNTEENEQEEIDDQHYTIVPNNKAKDVCLDNNNSNAISKKSLSFLLKKMFICGGGFSPTYSLRDPTIFPPKTRINKILRALLRRKIYPHSPCSSMTRKKCLESRHAGSNNFDDDDDDEIFYLEGTYSSKWVKTDTEYIVLEI